MESFHPASGFYDTNAAPGLARRSISIFSRRGPESPDASNFSIFSANTMLQAQGSHRQSLWKRRRGFANKKDQANVVLHAVPPADILPPMTALGLAMSTSLDEDIASAFDQNVAPQSSYSRKDSMQPSLHSHKQKKTDSRIGVWRNGVAHWDVERKPSAVLEFSGLYFPTPGPLSPPPQRPLPVLPTLSTAARPISSVVVSSSDAAVSTEMQAAKPRPSLSYFPIDTPAESARYRSLRLATDEASIHPTLRTSSSPSNEDVPFQYANVHHRRDVSLSESIATSAWSASSGTGSTEESSERMSCYSRHSSMTSVGEESEGNSMTHGSDWNCRAVPRRSVSAAFSILSPVQAGVFDDHSSRRKLSEDLLSPTSKPTLELNDHMNGSSLLSVASPPSPTLSEAVYDLQAQLGSISEGPRSRNESTASDDISPDQSIPAQTLQRVPTIPRKSRKRHWKASSVSFVQNALPESQANVLVRQRSAPVQQTTTHSSNSIHERVDIRRTTSERYVSAGVGPVEQSGRLTSSACASVLTPNMIVYGGSSEHHDMVACPDSSGTPAEAQSILLRIMSGLHTLDDLNATSRINKGMWRVYKENEIALLRTVQWNQSPAAWELREWSVISFSHVDYDVTSSQPQHTPASYRSCARRDKEVIDELKVMILENCQTFLRPESTVGLASTGESSGQRFDDAFYRIWCFCKIFGCEKGREDDIAGQLDWLKGGLLAHQQDCGATVSINFEFDMASVLLNAPDYFAQGNLNGLSAAQLYDMIELRNCLAVLLQGFGGRVEQARSCGVFDHCETAVTGVEEEDAVLEEWISHILTLGPSVILELARFSQDQSDAGFKLAKFHGWTDWEPPMPGTSRSTFLREPLTKLYEERLVATMVHQNSDEVEMKEVDCKRVATLAAEIKLARSSGTYRLLPVSDMANGRPMSTVSQFGYTTPARVVSPAPPAHSCATLQAMWSPRRISPIIEDRVETFNRLSLLTLDGVAHDTSERAIKKIMDMGFTVAQAKEALRLTDMGDGLRVDRAVDMLLRQQ